MIRRRPRGQAEALEDRSHGLGIVDRRQHAHATAAARILQHIDGEHALQVLALAREDLETAGRYCLQLHDAGAPRGIIAFTALPVLLARNTLDVVEKDGAGAKLTRPEVRGLVERLDQALDQGTFPKFWSEIQGLPPRG